LLHQVGDLFELNVKLRCQNLRKEIRQTELLSSVALMIRLLAEYKGYKIAGGKREFLIREVLTFCSSPNSIRLVKSDRMKLARHVERIIGMRNLTEFRQQTPKDRHTFGDLSLDLMLIL
jgi:hypothetical protein